MRACVPVFKQPASRLGMIWDESGTKDPPPCPMSRIAIYMCAMPVGSWPQACNWNRRKGKEESEVFSLSREVKIGVFESRSQGGEKKRRKRKRSREDETLESLRV